MRALKGGNITLNVLQRNPLGKNQERLARSSGGWSEKLTFPNLALP